jgi:hypothetical protein
MGAGILPAGASPQNKQLLRILRAAAIVEYLDKRGYTAGLRKWEAHSQPAPDTNPKPTNGIDGAYAGFLLLHGSERFLLAIPYWFLVPAMAICAWSSWLGWSNRFSLRTLLIGMTVVAALLGLVVWAAR